MIPETVLAAWALLAGLGCTAAESPPELPRVVFLTESVAFQHDVVERPAAGELSLAERALVEAAKGRFEVAPSQDSLRIGRALDEIDVLVLYTTGDLAIEPERLAAWVRDGGALVGIHSASDTLRGSDAYVSLLGGRFERHPWNGEVGVRVLDADHPSTAHLSDGFRIADEIYELDSLRTEPLHVLLELDPSSVDLERGDPERPHPLAWAREYGRGRVFYTALGHRPELWEDPRFLAHVLGGIEWAHAGPPLSRPAPEGAVSVLANENDLTRWRHVGERDATWRWTGEAVEVVPGSGDLVGPDHHSDAHVHVEFRIPEDAGDTADRGNSGVYLQGRYELQVLDTFGLPPASDRCGGLYGIRAPDAPAGRPAGEWQTFDVFFRVARLDGRGIAQWPRMSVWHNGVLVHDDVELRHVTPGGLSDAATPSGPLLLQEHGARVEYRQVWIDELR